MAFHRLLDTWNRDRRLRTELPCGRRVGSIEAAIGGVMTPGSDGHWQQLPLDPDVDLDSDVHVGVEVVDGQALEDSYEPDGREPGEPGDEDEELER